MNANETSVQYLCVCVLASTGSSLAVPLCLGKNQSACQPSNTSRLLRYLSWAIPLCMCVFVCVSCHSVNLCLSILPPSRCAFCLSVLPSGPSCLFCARPFSVRSSSPWRRRWKAASTPHSDSRSFATFALAPPSYLFPPESLVCLFLITEPTVSLQRCSWILTFGMTTYLLTSQRIINNCDPTGSVKHL